MPSAAEAFSLAGWRRKLHFSASPAATVKLRSLNDLYLNAYKYITTKCSPETLFHTARTRRINLAEFFPFRNHGSKSGRYSHARK